MMIKIRRANAITQERWGKTKSNNSWKLSPCLEMEGQGEEMGLLSLLWTSATQKFWWLTITNGGPIFLEEYNDYYD